ncbi:MAG: TonB-dependent receptor, partial [Marinilabiliaceae bacterium]|nr:TonB-dependent receptor [Marinilabiliaceae bacterium]
TNGTITDIDGNYSVALSGDEATLVYSFIGFKLHEVFVGNQKEISVVLQDEMTDLDEVVVVGYGEMRKSDLTGSVASLTVNNATESGVPSVNQLLQGRVSGVNVKSNSGVPGGAVDISIRGVGSMSASNQPLFVVDGMILDTEGGQAGDESTIGMTASNPLSFLSPEDIERMEILKDASATAIYGSRGANGVVLITTKKGKKGKGEFTYTNSFAFSEVEKYIPVMNGHQYASYKNELDSLNWEADGRPTESPGYSYPDTVQLLPVNWQEEYFQKAFSQSHRVAFSKSDENSSLFLSGGYVGADGVIESTGFEKVDVRLNSSKEISDKLQVTTNFNVSRLENDMTTGTEVLGGNRSMVGSIVFSPPLLNGALDENGDFDPEEFYNAPDSWVNDHTDKSIEYTAVSKIGLDYKLNKAFKLTGRFGFDYKNKERKRYFGRGIHRGYDEGGIGELYNMTNFHWVSDVLLNYNRTFNKDHRVAITLGGTADQKVTKNQSFRSSFFVDDVLGAEAMHAGAVQEIVYTRQYNVKYLSALFRANYSYKGKASLTVTGRQDYSNKFAEGNRGAFFPSFAGAYRLSEESFMQGLEFVTNLKVRAGWGQVGNSSSPSFATVNTMGFSKVAAADGSVKMILVAGQKGNPNLTWETSEQTNVGLDLGLFSNRISLTVDAYNKRTRDQLQRVTLSPEYGYNYLWYNLGEVQNKGLEFSVNADIIRKKDFHASIGGNISFNRNKIIDMGGNSYMGDKLGNNAEIKDPVNLFQEGEAVGVFYGFKTDGIIQTADEAASAPLYYGIQLPEGNLRFVDTNNDGEINDLDKTIIGDPNPDFIYGFNGEFGYKGFTLDFLFTGAQGREVFNGNYGRLNNFHITGTNKLAEAYEQAWRPDAPSHVYPRIDYEQSAFSSVYTDQWVEDASFLRLNNVTLSYLWKPKTDKVNNIKFYVTGTNLLTITNYGGFDPEVDSFSWDPRRVGIDLNSFPSVRTFLFGINASF